MNKAKSKISLFIIVLFILSACGQQDKVHVIKLGHALDVTHPVHKAMVYMADLVQKKSGGKLRIDIYPSGQLGEERDLVELLQIGSLGMTKVSSAALEGFVPEMKIFGIPYIFKNDEQRWKVLNGSIGKKLLLDGQKFHLRGLCYYDAGSRSFYTKEKPIRYPSDLRGMKIRVMKSITSMEMVRTLGGSATPIPWGELYTALQQGVVDGAENNPPSFYLSRHYEVCKYYSLDEHTSVPDVLLMSTIVWDQLNDQEKEWVQEAATESVGYEKKLWKKASNDALKAVEAAGVEVLHPDKELFREKVQKMHESYKGTEIYDLIKKIEKIR